MARADHAVRPRISERPSRRYRRRTLRVDVQYDAADGPRIEPATTLGAGGLFIETEDPLEPGTSVKLRFSLYDTGPGFEITGRVVWRRRPTDTHGHACGMGIEFTDRESAVALARELERL